MAHDKRAELDADFTAFVEANARRIRSLAEWLSGDPERAADLAQSALERTYVRWGDIRSQDPMVYVRRALLNQQRDWWRRRQHRPEWPAAVVPDVVDLDDHAAGHAQRDVMRVALAQLTRRERQVLVLRYYADLADADIAAEIGIAVGTVKSTASRALRKLRVLLGPVEVGVPLDSAANLRAGNVQDANFRAGNVVDPNVQDANVPSPKNSTASLRAASAPPASTPPASTPPAHRTAPTHPTPHLAAASLAAAHLRPTATRRRGEA